MGIPQEYDLTRRRLVLHDIPIAIVGAITLALFNGCADDSKKIDSSLELDLSEPLKLPPEFQERGIKMKEIIQMFTGYVYAEAFATNPNTPLYKPRLEVFNVEVGTAQRSLLNKDGGGPGIRYYDFALAPNGKEVALAFARDERNAKSLNLKTVDIVSRREKNFEGSLLIRPDSDPAVPGDIQWSYDSSYLSSSSSAKIWEARTGKVVYSETEVIDVQGPILISRFFQWSPVANRVVISSLFSTEDLPPQNKRFWDWGESHS